MQATVTNRRSYSAKVNQNGRVVIPAGIREELGFTPGQTLLLDVEDGILRIESYPARIRRIQNEFAQLIPTDRSLADELVAERREEARREVEEFEHDRMHRQSVHDGTALKDGTPG